MGEQRRFTRIREGAVLGGVCAAIARTFGIDITLVRVAFIILGLVNLLGVMIYLVLWLILPDEDGGELAGEETLRHNFAEMRARLSRLGREGSVERGPMIAGLVLITIGAVILIQQLTGVSVHRLWPLALITIGAIQLLKRVR